MGGHSGGDLASRLIVEVLPKIIEELLEKSRGRGDKAVKRLLKKSVFSINRYVINEGAKLTGIKSMGATLVVLFVLKEKERGFICNVGDSRAYLLRKGRIKLLSREHSVVGELVDKGHIEEHESVEHPAAGQITRYIGIDGNAEPDITALKIYEGDRFILCSDGLTDLVDDTQIRDILSHKKGLQTALETLIKAANDAGGYDNITVVGADIIRKTPVETVKEKTDG